MSSQQSALLEALARDRTFLGLRRGIEKESLRVAPDGLLAQTPHPQALGSTLTHPYITTDFSEAQLELITEVFESADACLQQLDDIHRFVYAKLDHETLWAASMPCVLKSDAQVPIASFGSSNVGMAKTVYRRGLGHRYGRLMQTISGIHYNFSLPDDFWPWFGRQIGDHGTAQDVATRGYFALIRNFRRLSWLLLYLFGASPAVCKSFLNGRDNDLEPFDKAGTLYRPYATSLRMGGLGYQSEAQANLHVSYNGFEQYARTLRDALTRPYPPYEAAGLQSENGEFQQLSTSLLQIENEFYGTIRPKRSIHPGERPLRALGERGVEYVEVRCMDLDPFLPLGIDTDTMRFLDVFLLHCLLQDSPQDSPEEVAAIARNQALVVNEGRRPGLALESMSGVRDRTEWAREILSACADTARVLDVAYGDNAYSAAVERQLECVEDPEMTPSGRILKAMRDQKLTFFRFAMQASTAHAEHFRQSPLAAAQLAEFERISARSLRDQRAIEAEPQPDFASYRRAFIEQELLPEHTALASPQLAR